MVCQASNTSQTLNIFDMLLCVDLASPTVSLMASLKCSACDHYGKLSVLMHDQMSS